MLVCAAVVNVPTMLVPDRLPPVMLPVAEINPPVSILPPVILADTLTVVPVCVVALTLAPPNTLPPVMLPVADINPPVRTLPPVTLPVALAVPPVAKLPPVIVAADVIVPVAETNPPVKILPPVILPVAEINPVTYSPVVAYTATLLVPPTPMATLPPELTTRTFDVPFCIDVASIPVSCDPLPKK